MLTVLVDAYDEEAERVVLRLNPQLAPIKAAVFALVNKDGMPEAATQLFEGLRKDFKVFYDAAGSVGRRYRRQDEAGTPYCITIDGQTLQDQTVTVRERDSMEQVRINLDKVYAYLKEHIALGE
jgi:glycyl-tRNA synthetase